MLRVFICEDNLKEKEELEKIIKNIILIENYDMELCVSTSNPYEILDELKINPVSGIYFLDVDLNSDINGIQLAEKIRKYDPRGFIIFITTHAEMSHLTFKYKVEAMDYILKDEYPLNYDKIYQCMQNAHTKYTTKSHDMQKVFSIKVDDKIINIEYDKILFFETSPKIHRIIIHAENRQVEFYGKMKDLEGLLDDSFYRCHSSYIVNKSKIKEIDILKRVAYMTNDEECLISFRKLKKLL